LRLQSRSSRENPWRAHFSCGVLLLLLLLLHWSSLKFNRFISCLRFGAESTNAGFVFNKKKNKFSFTDSLNKLSESESKQDSHYILHSFSFDFIKYKYHKSDGTLVCGFHLEQKKQPKDKGLWSCVGGDEGKYYVKKSFVDNY
jgi:hypothetical protein